VSFSAVTFKFSSSKSIKLKVKLKLKDKPCRELPTVLSDVDENKASLQSDLQVAELKIEELQKEVYDCDIPELVSLYVGSSSYSFLCSANYTAILCPSVCL